MKPRVMPWFMMRRPIWRRSSSMRSSLAFASCSASSRCVSSDVPSSSCTRLRSASFSALTALSSDRAAAEMPQLKKFSCLIQRAPSGMDLLLM